MPNPPLDADRDIWFLGTLMRLHARGNETAGRFTLIEQLAPAGFSPPRHVHATEDTMMYVLEGRLTVQVGDERRNLLAGQSVFLPRGVPHTFRADAQTRLLEIGTPGGFDEFYLANSEPARTLGLPLPSPPDIERLERTSREHGTSLLGPPLGPDD